MIAATWLWVLAGVAFVVVVGVLIALLIGAAGMPGDFLRRLGQTARPGRTERGSELPGEVPAAGAEETAESVDDDQVT